MSASALGAVAEVSVSVRDAVLPHWPLPLKSEVNPLLPQAGDDHLAWLKRFGLVAPECRTVPLHVHEVASYAFPHAGQDVLNLLTDWTGWFFHFDDFLDEGPAGNAPDLARTLIDCAVGRPDGSPSPPPGAGVEPSVLECTRQAYEDLYARTRCRMSPAQLRVFDAHMDAYFEALIEEAANRHRNTPPGLSDYCRIRRFTGPAPPQTDLIELAESVRLPYAFYDSAEFHELINAASDIASWSNDVFSAAKEQARGDMHNLVLVLARQNAVPLTDAALQAVAMIRARLQAMEDTAARTLQHQRDAAASPTACAALEQWINGLRCYLAHCAWYVDHTRYGTQNDAGHARGGAS
ncbi:hypothetical protein [Streptomyces sp. NBRC 110028]|uniref:terpene synthase family protein n=1 Tax=Streptomyces sp. NBRC 110028 TaxID=1621260 RepID=UPI0006E1C92F|nr:hypothetical protein [Streptomyces sp. NBRC 110028]